MMKKRTEAGKVAGWRHGVALAVFLLLPVMAWGGRSDVKPAVWSPHSRPSCTMNLGPIGVQAWIRGYQFHVVSVDAGSPADGVLEPGDMVAGAGGVEFSGELDSRIVLGRAIGEAEAGDGRLKLTVMRDGSRKELVLELPRLGAFAEGWPYGCSKSQRILQAACEYILEAQLPKGIVVTDGGVGTFHSGLLLLASGEPRYLDGARRAVYATAAMEHEKNDLHNWAIGYGGLLMAEYYLATGDMSVLDRLQELVKFLEKGQMRCGSWGHGCPPGGYGAMNQAGIICTMALVLAQECGLEVDREVLGRSLKFFSQFSELGAVPYGDHMPGVNIPDDNGKSSSTAVLCTLVPELNNAAASFAQSVSMSYWMREQGHTGGFFSMIWGPLAADMAGADAFKEFMEYQEWYYNLSRTWRGALVMLPYFEALTRFDSATYSDFGGEFTTGGLGLVFAMPHRKLRILGAPRSIFGASLPAGSLRDARDAFQKRQWDIYDSALKGAGKDGKTPDDNRWLDQLTAAKAMLDDSTAATAREIENNLAEGDQYRASEQYDALKRFLGSEHNMITNLAPRFVDSTVTWNGEAGKRYYEAWEKLRAFNFQSWFSCGESAKKLVGAVPPLRPKVWEAIMSVSPDVLREWKGDEKSGHVEWSGVFNLSTVDYKELRIKFRAPRNSHSVVYINGGKAAEILRGQRSGYAKIPLDGSAVSLLKEGENAIKVTGTSVGSGENALDIGLDGVLGDQPLAPAPVRTERATVALPDKDFRTVLAKARQKAESIPFADNVNPEVPERLRVRDSYDRFRSALEAECLELEESVLSKAMESPASYWRYLAVQSLSMRGETGWRVAAAGLTNVNWRVRSAACEVFAVTGCAAESPADKADVLNRLTSLLTDDNAWVRCRAAAALGVTGTNNQQVVAGLAKLAADADTWVRKTAIGSLAKVTDDPEVLLKAACNGLMIPDTSFSVLGACLPLIEKHGGNDEAVIQALVACVENPGEGMGSDRLNKVMEQLVQLDTDGTKSVLAIAKVAQGGYIYDRLRGNPRKRAIELLGEMGAKAAPVRSVLESIEGGADEKEAPLREAARTALKAIRGSGE